MCLTIIPPWKRAWSSLESPSPKDALCHVWLKLPVAQWFWRKRFSCVWFNAILLICYHSPMKMVWPFIWKKAWIIVTKVYFVPSLVEIAPVVQVKKMKMWKAYYSNNYQYKILIRKAHLNWALSLDELKIYKLRAPLKLIIKNILEHILSYFSLTEQMFKPILLNLTHLSYK